jgi:hypothetical protein
VAFLAQDGVDAYRDADELGALGDGGIHAEGVLGRMALADGEVLLVHLARDEEPAEHPARLGGASADDQATGLAIQAVRGLGGGMAQALA